MKNEMEKVEASSPNEMIREAVKGGADLEKLKGLLELQERWEANEARKAYHVAMSDFKAVPLKIEKDKKVSFGNTKYSHASLANVVETITSELSKHGLSASWRTKQNGTITVFCRITHVLGHCEETELSAAADSSGSKNPIQAIGSTVSYLQRYTLLAALGLATYDQDDDAKSVDVDTISSIELSNLTDLITATETDFGRFLKWLKVESLESLPKSEYTKALNALKAKGAK